MKNVLVLGSGRSGTSMVAGCFAGAGYFLGDQLIESAESNPKGFFEDVEVNAVNEEILEPVAPKRRRGPLAPFTRRRPAKFQRWLLALPAGVRVELPAGLESRIRRLVDREPYCFKDPRFTWTLPAWRPWLRDSLLVVVFRHPLSTARSIVAECERDPRLQELRMTLPRALRIWSASYERILRLADAPGDWLFLHYDQVLDGSGLARLEQRCGSPLDRAFPDASLRRSSERGELRGPATAIYRRLANAAGYRRDGGSLA